MSALYLGSGNLEKFMLATLENKLKKSKKLRVNMLYDYYRGTRLNKDHESTQTVLKDLSLRHRHNHHINVGFWKNPAVGQALSSLGSAGLREVVGVHHIKAYVFDNNVLMSGANLEEQYFTDRQDRYMLFKNCPELANYVDDFLKTIINNSYQVEDDGDLKMSENQPDETDVSKMTEAFGHQVKMFLWSNRVKTKEKNYEDFFKINEESEYKPGQQNQNKNTQNQEEQQSSDSEVLNMNENDDGEGINEEVANEDTKEENQMTEEQKQVKQAIQAQYFREDPEFLRKLNERKDLAQANLKQVFDEVEASQIVRRLEDTLYKFNQYSDLVDMGEKVYIFPIFNIPAINYQKDQQFFLNLIKNNVQNEKTKIKLASGYLNLTDDVVKMITDPSSKAQVDLLTAAPAANGFYNAGKFKSWIPYFYRTFEHRLLKQAKNNGRENSVRIHEFYKELWTFHSKGFWLYENDEEYPSMSMIGSTNFSYRSYNRDTELNFYLYTTCPRLKKEMHMEAMRQFHNSTDVTNKDLKNDEYMKFSFITEWLGRALKSFM